jgi:predicted RNA-binding Zn-ribbon protein involved in translation (DUF1610 family)
MGHKKVCLLCRLCLNRDIADSPEQKYICPQCGQVMQRLSHRFRPPKKSEDKAWQLVSFLINNGFPFQHIYQVGKNEYLKTRYDNYIPYPKNLREAKEFVEKHKIQAKKQFPKID